MMQERALAAWHPAFVVATWFGSGLLPRLPGTWGSMAALPFAWAIVTIGGATGLAVAAVAVFLLGWWASSVVVDRLQLDDPGLIVVDEVAGQWLVLLVVPPDLFLYVVGFVVFRVLDIIKPWPASWADRYVKGGFGVMLDDVLAAGYGFAFMAMIVWWSAA